MLRFDDHSVYFAGDTCVFGDMALIARLYQPTVAVLPIGDNFTIDPEEVALALELLGNPCCVSCHWGTFPLLTGTPDRLVELTSAGRARSTGRHDRTLNTSFAGVDRTDAAPVPGYCS